MPTYRMRYSAVPRDRFYVKTYGYLSFAKKNMVKSYAVSTRKNSLTSQKYHQQLLPKLL